MIKQVKFHYSVSELGNLQLRQVVEYVKDGKVKNKKYSHPITPTDPQNMKDWDVRSQEIVAAIFDPIVKVAFEAEIEAGRIQTDDIVETVTYDRVIEEDGKIAVRRITRIFDNDKEVSKKYHRSWIMPGDDYSNADVISKALAAKLHMPEVILNFKKNQDDKNSL